MRLYSKPINALAPHPATALANAWAYRFPHSLLWLCILLLVVFIVWARWTVVDQVVRGSGKVIPARQIQVVQNLEGGILAELLVQEGSHVTQGQPLLLLDTTYFSAEYGETEQQRLTLQAKMARLDAELAWTQARGKENAPTETTPALPTAEAELFAAHRQEWADAQSAWEAQLTQKEHALAELRAQQKQVARNVGLAQKELNISRPLVKEGVLSEIELLRLERETGELEGRQQTLQAGIPRVEAEAAEVRQKMREWQTALRGRLLEQRNEARATLAGLLEKRPALADRVSRATVRSPVAGTVKRLNLTTLGGVVQPGMDLVEIVPSEDNLLIEARVQPADIGFLYPGQTAMITFTAYEYAWYGGLSARLDHISADSLNDEHGGQYYLVRLTTAHQTIQTGNAQGKPLSLPILPGMVVSVDIIIGARTVWEYLTAPVTHISQRALRER